MQCSSFQFQIVVPSLVSMLKSSCQWWYKIVLGYGADETMMCLNAVKVLSECVTLAGCQADAGHVYLEIDWLVD